MNIRKMSVLNDSQLLEAVKLELEHLKKVKGLSVGSDSAIAFLLTKKNNSTRRFSSGSNHDTDSDFQADF